MATFGDFSTEIQVDVGGRTDNDLKTVVDAAINRAIERYEQERFSFNVDIDNSLASAIDETDYTLPTQFLKVVAIQYLSNDDLDLLQQWSYKQHLMAIDDDTNDIGDPEFYAIFGRNLFIYPAPSEVSTFTISGVVRLSDIPFDDDAEENAWTNEGASLIRAVTKWDLYSNRLKNAELAALNEKIAKEQLAYLRRDVEALETIGRVPIVEPF